MRKITILFLLSFNTLVVAEVVTKPISVELKLDCINASAVLTFSNKTLYKVEVNKSIIAYNGKLSGSSFELWNGERFATYKGAHLHHEESDTITIGAYGTFTSVINLMDYYDIKNGNEYKIVYREDGSSVKMKGKIFNMPLISNEVVCHIKSAGSPISEPLSTVR